MRTVRIAASLLAANLGQLEQEVKRMEEAQVDAIHIDVMDGHFVPYFALGADDRCRRCARSRACRSRCT